MKLVIDIDDEEYSEFIKADKNGYCTRMIDIKAIKNGTPLDDIKAEIEQYRENEEPHLCDYRFYRNEGLDMALAVIDRHIGESKDAEWHESEPLDDVVVLMEGVSE